MGKSLDEIYRKMQQQQAEQRRTEMEAEDQRRQLAERQRREWVERNRIYEKAFNPSAAASAAAGAGGSIPLANFLTFNYIDNNLYWIRKNGQVLANVQPFVNTTTLCDCEDDKDFIYYVTLDESDNSIFGKMSKSNFTRTDIDTVNLNEETQKKPASMYYEGSGNFIYLCPSIEGGSETSEIYRISQDGQVVNQLSSTSNVGLFPFGICQNDGTSYVSMVEGDFLSALYTLDIDTFDVSEIDYFSMNVESLPNGITNTKVWYVFDLVKYGTKIYANVIFTDKDAFYPYQIIGEINLELATINYYLPVSDGFEGAFTSLVVY